MRIKIDIDNTIRNIEIRMLAVYNSTFNESLTVNDIKYYDVNMSFPKCDNAQHFFFNSGWTDYIFNSGIPMNGAIEGLELLKELGHEIIIVSYQPNIHHQQITLDWLKKYHIPYDAVVFVNKEDKTLVNADYIIDDNPKFLDADPAKKVCIDWAYNRHKEYDYRVKSIYEFVTKYLK